jgi:hypothetical protein
MTLITRQGKGSKLTIQDMDGNLTYLEQIAQEGGGSTYEGELSMELYVGGDIPDTEEAFESKISQTITVNVKGFLYEKEETINLEVDENIFVSLIMKSKRFSGIVVDDIDFNDGDIFEFQLILNRPFTYTEFSFEVPPTDDFGGLEQLLSNYQSDYVKSSYTFEGSAHENDFYHRSGTESGTGISRTIYDFFARKSSEGLVVKSDYEGTNVLWKSVEQPNFRSEITISSVKKIAGDDLKIAVKGVELFDPSVTSELGQGNFSVRRTNGGSNFSIPIKSFEVNSPSEYEIVIDSTNVQDGLYQVSVQGDSNSTVPNADMSYGSAVASCSFIIDDYSEEDFTYMYIDFNSVSTTPLNRISGETFINPMARVWFGGTSFIESDLINTKPKFYFGIPEFNVIEPVVALPRIFLEFSSYQNSLISDAFLSRLSSFDFTPTMIFKDRSRLSKRYFAFEVPLDFSWWVADDRPPMVWSEVLSIMKPEQF